MHRGPLRPGELAEAVVLADMALALTIVGQVVPIGGILLAAATVPMAVIAARHRLRAVIAGTIAASVVGFLVVGTAALTSTVLCGAFGAVIGAGDRRGWSGRRTTFTGLALLWPPLAGFADLMLFLFADSRELFLENVRNGWDGLFNLLENFGLASASETGNDFIDWVTRNWWLSVPLTLFAVVWIGLWLARGLSTPALRRVRRAFGDPGVEADVADRGLTPGPLPVALHDVSFRYPGATTDALSAVTVTVEPSELLAVVGPNGSGKSTLARIIAGRRAPTTGTVERPGATALGRRDGTAIVFQRPEAQVLGVRVRDDVVWGLDDPSHVDIDAVLARVGLVALAERETSTLSGGELQRLAVAAALARAPRLLVSDESTAMVDADGRAQLVGLLSDIAAADGVSVVHVTHHPSEAARADRVIALDHGRLVERPEPNSAPVRPRRADTHYGGPVLRLEGVGHVYARGTPWAHRALKAVDLTIHARESVLVVGHNGSGKSTLAWVLAGLLVPSEGDARFNGEPVAANVGQVGLAFQHARLQLLRPTVIEEVRSVANVELFDAYSALRAVGLDPHVVGDKRVDELSGGQARRVVLAGVLAAHPGVIVLDEPFAGLDTSAFVELEALLGRLRREHGVALVIVSHDQDLHHGLVDRVVELRGGRIVRDEPAITIVEREHQ
jgi:energy-coupling factor transport system ATP-binding protein